MNAVDTPKGTLTSEIVEVLRGTDLGSLTEEAMEVATQVCLDGIGVMIAGQREPMGLGRITIEYVRSLGGTPEASVIGGSFLSSANNAAYANGTLAHALDWDNTSWPLNHPTSPTLPAILAVAERDGRSGGDVLLALILAFEVQGRMRMASAGVGTGTGFHKPGVSGLIGATAAVSKLLELDATAFRMAFGIAGSRAGSMAANTGTMTKSSHSGHAARMGVEAATLAQLGWTAHEDIFGEGGFLELFYGTGSPRLELFVADFGAPYRIVDPGVGFKKHPCNYFTHRPIDAAMDLAATYNLEPSDIHSVQVDFPDFAYVDRPVPRTGLEGKFSVQYTTAIALIDRAITVNSFSDERRFAPDVESLLPRIELNVRDDIPMDFPETYSIVRVRTNTGRLLEARCDKPRGMWGVPLTREERLAKFRACLKPTFAEAQSSELIDLVEHIRELKDIRRVMALASGRSSMAEE